MHTPDMCAISFSVHDGDFPSFSVHDGDFSSFSVHDGDFSPSGDYEAVESQLPHSGAALLQQRMQKAAEDAEQLLAVTHQRDNLLAKIKSFEEQHKRMLGTLDREYANSKDRGDEERIHLRKERDAILRQLHKAEQKNRMGSKDLRKEVDVEKAKAEEAVQGRKNAEEQRNKLVRQLARLR